jgi:hypothetical protein
MLAAGAAAALAAAGATWRAGAEEGPALAPGTGTATAQIAKVDPRAGNLSLGITAGLALADYTNRVARAESRSVDLGVIGTTLAAEPCDGGEPALPADQQPQPLHTETGDPGAAGGLSAADAGVATKRVQATDQPLGVAETAVASTGIPGVVEIAGARARAEAGFVSGQRLARATTDIDEVRLAGGLVVLRGLHWEALHTSGPTAPKATFTIDGATVAGTSVPVGSAGGAEAAVEQLNAVLAPLGIRVQLPAGRTSGGVLFLDPLTVSVVPAEARDDVLGAVVGAVQPLREAAFAPLVEGCTELSKNGKSAVTVFDVALGSLTGAGSFAVALGGVQATTADIAFSNVLGGLDASSPAAEPPVGGPVGGAGLADDVVRTGPSPQVATPASTPPAVPTGASGERATAAVARSGAGRAALAVVALAVLAATALAAGADWWSLRRRADAAAPGGAGP